MSVHEIWDFFCKSKRARISATKLALVREDDAQGGVKEGTVPTWQRKLLTMYREQASLTFLRVNRLSVASDASRHDCRDFQVATAYDPENRVGAYLTSMYVCGSKVVHPGEFDLSPELERLAARREIERLKSLKFLQALSCQLQSLVRLSLEDFLPSESLRRFLLPLRGQDTSDSIDSFEFASRAATRSVPVLHVILDQSSVGCAAAAFLSSLPVMAHFSYDKYHRVTNDLKRPLQGVLQE